MVSRVDGSCSLGFHNQGYEASIPPALVGNMLLALEHEAEFSFSRVGDVPRIHHLRRSQTEDGGALRGFTYAYRWVALVGDMERMF